MPFHVPDRRVYTVTVRLAKPTSSPGVESVLASLGSRPRIHVYFVELTDAEKSLLEKVLSGPEIAESSVVPTDILVLTELNAALREELHLEVV